MNQGRKRTEGKGGGSQENAPSDGTNPLIFFLVGLSEHVVGGRLRGDLEAVPFVCLFLRRLDGQAGGKVNHAVGFLPWVLGEVQFVTLQEEESPPPVFQPLAALRQPAVEVWLRHVNLPNHFFCHFFFLFGTLLRSPALPPTKNSLDRVGRNHRFGEEPKSHTTAAATTAAAVAATQ